MTTIVGGRLSLPLGPVRETYLQFATNCVDAEVMWVGGVGCSKSDALITRMGLIAGAHSGMKSIIARSDSVKLGLTTLQKFREKWDAPGYGVFKQLHGSLKVPVFEWANGHTTIFLGLGDYQAIQRLKSLEVMAIGIDEADEIDEDVWRMARGRLREQRNDGHAVHYSIAAVANYEGRNWIYRRFKANEYSNERDGKRLFEARTADNHSLPKDYIKNLQANGADWIRKYVDGSWDSASGLIFPEFRAEIHVRQTGIDLRDRAVSYFVCIDHGLRAPTAATLWAIDGDGRWYGIREYYQAGLNAPQNAENIRLWAADVRVKAWIIDPSTFNVDSRTGSGSVAFDYEAAGIPVQAGNNNIEAGIVRCRSLLSTPGLLTISPTMMEFKREIESWSWKNRRDTGRETPESGGDHLLDGWRYLAMHVRQGYKAEPSVVERSNSQLEQFMRDDDRDSRGNGRRWQRTGGY